MANVQENHRLQIFPLCDLLFNFDIFGSDNTNKRKGSLYGNVVDRLDTLWETKFGGKSALIPLRMFDDTSSSNSISISKKEQKKFHLLNFREQSYLYRNKSNVALPQFKYNLSAKQLEEQLLHNLSQLNFQETDNISDEDKYIYSEDFGKALIKDYVLLGESKFTTKYTSHYIAAMARSDDHSKSLQRLVDENTSKNNLFQGEVLSALLSPLLEIGAISPRLLYHAREIICNDIGLRSIAIDRPSLCRLRLESIRKGTFFSFFSFSSLVLTCSSSYNITSDWHVRTVTKSALQYRTDHVYRINPEYGVWQFNNKRFRGYLQREGHMLTTQDINGRKPLLFFVHGMGGTIEQFTGLAQELHSEFDVHALDMIGFGCNEKPPLSYNQYLWRDQIVEYVMKVVNEKKIENEKVPVIIAGNSIGGYMATLAAAELAKIDKNSDTGLISGLILFNSAGRVLDNVNGSETLSGGYFPVYKGVPPELLRFIGKVIVSGLQPNIGRVCKDLYPSNREHVDSSGLSQLIFRDSCDPGAIDVIASGAKLPPSVPVNSALQVFDGPVLVCQGIKDPLNNATARALLYGKIREGITLDLLPLGHCPFDENPQIVAESIRKWVVKANVLLQA